MNGFMRSEGDSPSMPCMRVPLIPLPIALFGTVVAFMFGATLGIAVSRRREMMMQGGMHGEMHGGKPWMHRGMKPHHHHGHGTPACCEQHDEWRSPETMAREPAE